MRNHWDLEAYIEQTVHPAAHRRRQMNFGQFLYIGRWKSHRPMRFYVRNRDATVRATTAAAFAANLPDAQRNQVLIGTQQAVRLQGVQIRTASALLTWFDPKVYTVLDIWAVTALQNLNFGRRRPISQDPISYWDQHYWEYVSLCGGLAHNCGADLRSLDRALWKWAKCGCP
jgi:hypothetical protein